eukprot:scaffold38999_cov72-Phaeocystis_antarctica.AAC.1
MARLDPDRRSCRAPRWRHGRAMVLLIPRFTRRSLAARSTFYASPVARAEAAADPPESAGATYGGSDLRLRLRLRVSGTGEISCLIVFSAYWERGHSHDLIFLQTPVPHRQTDDHGA